MPLSEKIFYLAIIVLIIGTFLYFCFTMIDIITQLNIEKIIELG
jgi:hypothetical protein